MTVATSVVAVAASVVTVAASVVAVAVTTSPGPIAATSAATPTAASMRGLDLQTSKATK
jgi:hypothetical protein